jgi:hypothetical protein
MIAHVTGIGIAAVLLAGCGSTPEAGSHSFPDAPFATLSSANDQLVIEVRTAPQQPPDRGIDSVELVVRDRSGVLQDSLEVVATPWMPAMGHGASVVPTVSSPDKGRYVLDNVYLYMAGRWELRTSFSGHVMDSATPAFDIP